MLLLDRLLLLVLFLLVPLPLPPLLFLLFEAFLRRGCERFAVSGDARVSTSFVGLCDSSRLRLRFRFRFRERPSRRRLVALGRVRAGTFARNDGWFDDKFPASLRRRPRRRGTACRFGAAMPLNDDTGCTIASDCCSDGGCCVDS